MTKLLEWLIGGLVFLVVWATLITDTAFFQVSDQIKEVFIPVSKHIRNSGKVSINSSTYVIMYS